MGRRNDNGAPVKQGIYIYAITFKGKYLVVENYQGSRLFRILISDNS